MNAELETNRALSEDAFAQKFSFELLQLMGLAAFRQQVSFAKIGGLLCFAAITVRPVLGKDRQFPYFGRVPSDVNEQDRKALYAYIKARTEQEADEAFATVEKIAKFEANPGMSLEFVHRGVTLKGRVTSARNPLRVVMDAPYHSERVMHYGWETALAGRFILAYEDGEPHLSDDAINTAKELLKEIYDDHAREKASTKVISLDIWRYRNKGQA